MRPKKHLGQHFLKDVSIARRMVQAMEVQTGDHILEIGSGRGMLTQVLLESPADKIFAVEIDVRMFPELREMFSQNPRFHLIEADFLSLDLCKFSDSGKMIRIAGNLPYQATSPILFRVLKNRHLVQDMTIMVQKEVGERITSTPGSRTYGIPSVLLQAYAECHLLFLVSPHVFHPVPRVESCVMKMVFNKKPLYQIFNEELFQKTVKTAFGQRRKMLKNTISGLFPKEVTERSLPVDLRHRPEELSVKEWVELCNALERS